MSANRYIQVLLPLKLDWEPVYALPEGSKVQIGDKINVEFAHKTYPAIVSAIDVIPEPGIDVKIAGTEAGNDSRETSFSSLATTPSSSDLFRGSLKLLDFWKQLASYYLCTPGEVYKASFIKEKIKEKPLAKASLSPSQEAAKTEIKTAFSKGKTVLFEGSGREEIYTSLAMEMLSQGKSVLHLIPTRKKRMILELAASGDARYIMGTRNALFLPFENLGLVIVDDEQDTSFKQDSPAPRFNTREAAIMLANIHGASILLGSATPSLESLYNVERGLFAKVQLKQSLQKQISLINTAAEARKKGMSGSFSFKLQEEIKRTQEDGKKVLIVCRSKATVQECPEDVDTATHQTLKTINPEGYGLIAFLDADGLLGKEDFRSDERALQTLQQLAAIAPLAIQTREPKHPVFKALQDGSNGLTFLDERRACNLPPFTRIINIVIRDVSEKRINYLSKRLAESVGPCIGPYTPSFDGEEGHVRIIRITLERDKSLKSRKSAIYQAVKSFEKTHKYPGHIVIDVDPV